MSIKFHLVITSFSRPASTSTRRDYAICIRATTMHQGYASRRRSSTATANLHLDRYAIGLFTQRSRFGDDGWAPVFRFVSNDGKERSLYTQYNICRLFLSFCLLRQGFTHRRWCARKKIAYKLISESYSACATRRSNLRRVSDNDEMNLSKHENFELAQKIANLQTIYKKYSIPEPLRP